MTNSDATAEVMAMVTELIEMEQRRSYEEGVFGKRGSLDPAFLPPDVAAFCRDAAEMAAALDGEGFSREEEAWFSARPRN